jgi:fatty-acyl-CoA synthase
VIWRLLDTERVTHLDGAPTVLVTIANAAQAHPLEQQLVATVAGAPPSPTVIARIRELGARIVHVYGMTELYGPYTVNEWQPHWTELPAAEQARLQARQGVAMIHADPIRVVDRNMADVPRDGNTMGEIVMRGNNVMTGYFADEKATAEAFRGGAMHSGDLGVMHPDGYVELREPGPPGAGSGRDGVPSGARGRRGCTTRVRRRGAPRAAGSPGQRSPGLPPVPPRTRCTRHRVRQDPLLVPRRGPSGCALERHEERIPNRAPA